MAAYRRGRGVLRRSSSGHPELGSVNDGGRDAPMGPRDQRFFRHFFWVAAILTVGLIVWMFVE